MSRRRRRAFIFISVALLTILALVTVHAPVGARMRLADRIGVADTSSDSGLGEVPLEGRTFRVLYTTNCSAEETPTPDTWEFLVGGELVGQTITPPNTWEQRLPVMWRADVGASCSRFNLSGLSLGPAIIGAGSDGGSFMMFVVGIRS